MRNFIKEGDVITMTPGADVAAGVGYLFGTACFGVAIGAVANGVAGEFLASGVVDIAKTSALAITAGDVLYWDATNKCVNKTTSGQRAVGVALRDAANPSSTVRMRLGVGTLAGT